jgi:hypothetical protein
MMSMDPFYHCLAFQWTCKTFCKPIYTLTDQLRCYLSDARLSLLLPHFTLPYSLVAASYESPHLGKCKAKVTEDMGQLRDES